MGGGVHPNLQPQPEAQSKKFQPRWRQHADDLATAKEVQQQQREHPSSQPQDKPGFQARWRRTAAPSPSPEAPLEPQNPAPAKSFQPKWRERSERPPQEAPAPPPKAGFTPRWKRTLAETPQPVLPPVVEVPEVEAPVVEEPAPAPEPVEIAPAVESVEAIWAFEAPVETTPRAAVSLAAPLALAVETETVEELYAPTQPQGQSVEDTFLAGAVEVEVEIADAVSPEPPPAAPEKKRLPRPQAHSIPKMVALPAEMVEAELARVPNTEDTFQFEPEPEPEPVVARPKAIELKYLPVPIEFVEAPQPVEEAPFEPIRAPKRLDDEAIAALKATASLLTGSNRGQATPPPPPPPPSPPAPPRYVPTPTPRREPTVVAPPVKAKPAKAKKFFRREPNISMEEVSTFTRQFSVMIGAGLPIHQALNFFAESTTGLLGKIIDDVATKISSGFRLSNALAQHPAVFSEVYLGLVELGETSSHIDETLEKLADLLEKQVRLAKRLQSALVYPAFLVAVSMAAVGIFLQYVLPTMIPLFKSFSLTLPLPTRMLLASRHLVWPSVVLSLLGVLFWSWFRPAWSRARRSKAAWAYRVDRLVLKIPLFGKFIGQIAVARVLFALATMIETGLPIMNALKRCESVASNLEFAGRLEKAGDELRDGSTVTEALALYEVLPSSCLHLLSAGEESAQMAEMVQYAARFYEEEVDHSIDQFMSLVEPVIMCVMGVVVGFIVLSAVLPTVEMINHLGA